MARSRLTSVLVVILVVVGSLTGGLVGATSGGRDRDMPGPDWPGPDWPGPMTGPARVGGPSLLWLKAGTFDPIQDPIPVALGLRRASSEGLYLVQFESPLSDQLGARLEALGISVWSFIPEGGLVVSIPSPAIAIALSHDPEVRWSCPWQDGWKVHPSLGSYRGQVALSITTWRYDIDVSRDLARVGARVLEHLQDSYIVSVDAGRIGDIAALRQVSWIEPRGEATFLMDKASVTVGARQADNETYDSQKGAIWSWVKDDEYFDGLGGTSVLVDVTDTGVDATHIAFAGRVRLPFFKGIDPDMPVWTDPLGHGTVVAGILLGDGSYRLTEDPGDDTLVQGTYAGVAPGTYLMAQSLYGSGFTYTYRNLTMYSVEKGADISHNSWGVLYPEDAGTWGEYLDIAYDYDNSTRDSDWTTPGDQPILVVFAAGNYGGSGGGTILASATGKNVITVGATGNDKGMYSSDELWVNSSRGPTNDGRFKPDLVAPGEYVTSTWGIDDDGSTAAALPPFSGDASYITYNGTSMAAPIVSGSAALLIDHLGTNKGHMEPSPALVKSILIATADHLPGVQWPGNEQGWGRVNASRAILETSDRFVEWIDQSTRLSSTGETIAYKFDVTAGTPLTFSLVWTDIPGAVQAGKDLVNDLDLELLSPSGKVYRGNHISGGQSTEGGTADRTNNVEVTHFMTPEAGEWEVTVRANELPPVGGGGEQDFALVAVGNVQKKFVDIVAQNMSVRATDAAEGEVIPIAFDLTNEGKLPAGNVPWKLVLLDEEGEVFTILGSGVEFIGSLAGVRLYANWTAVRGTYTALAIPNIDRTIAEETYQNNDISKTFFIKGFGVNATLQLDVSAGDPGTDVSHTIEITNTGNTEDRYLIERTPPPTGWDARLDSTVLTIDPGVTRSAHLIVSIPEGAEAGTIVTIDVSITSQGNTTYFQEMTTQTQVIQHYGLTLLLDPRSQTAMPGESVDFTFTITNLGNGADTFSVVYYQTAGPSSGVGFSLPRSTFTVLEDGFELGTLTVSLDIDQTADLPKDATIAFNVIVTSLGDVNGETPVSADASGSVVILALHRATFLEPLPEEEYTVPGRDVSLTLGVHNNGNTMDLLRVTAVVPQGWGSSVDQPTITLAVGAMGNVQVTIIVPEDALGEVHTITVKLQTEDGEDLDSFDLPFLVEWRPGLSVTVDGTSDRNMTRGSELTYVIWVSNTGNRPDDVHVEFSGIIPGLLAEATPSTLSLAIDDRMSVTVMFNATPLAELKRGTIGVVFIFGEDLERVTAFVNVTVEIVPGPSDPGNDDDDDDIGGLSRGLIMGIVIAVVLVVVIVGLMMVTKNRRSSHKLEEGFFVEQREDRRTAEVLKEEQTISPRRPPPRPPSPYEGALVTTAESAPSAPPASQEAPARGGSCPECGNPMQSLTPPESGSYCPMCGHRTGGA